MAFPSVTEAVAKIVLEAKISVVTKIVKFLGSKMEIDDDFNNWIAEFIESLKEEETREMKETIKEAKKTSKKIKIANGEIVKKTRDPTVYNLYVKENMSSFRDKHPDVKDGRVLRRMLGEEWKEDPRGIFLAKKVVELKENDSSLTVHEAYEQAKEAWDNGDHEVEVKQKKSTKGKSSKNEDKQEVKEEQNNLKDDSDEDKQPTPSKKDDKKVKINSSNKNTKSSPKEKKSSKKDKEVKEKLKVEEPEEENDDSDDETIVNDDKEVKEKLKVEQSKEENDDSDDETLVVTDDDKESDNEESDDDE